MSEHQTSSLPPAGVSAPPCHHPTDSANTDGDSKDTLSCSVCYRWQNAQSQTSVGIQGNSSLKRHQGECETSLDPKPGEVITYCDQNQVSGSVSFTAGGSTRHGSHLVQTAPGCLLLLCPHFPGSQAQGALIIINTDT